MKRETVGQRLKRIRLERGMKQRQLAEPGVSYAYISRIEAGARRPSVKALRILAKKLDVSPTYLETGIEPGHVRVKGTVYEVPKPVEDLVVTLQRRCARLRQVRELESAN